jgi:D-alanyl-D-alanine carboxypeptidase
MMLAEEGLLDLSDRLVDVLGSDLCEGLLVVGGTDYTDEITIGQLLNHTSGLGDYWFDPPYDDYGYNPFTSVFILNEDRLWEPEEILVYARMIDPAGRPGQVYNYSDTNYLLLGLIAEKVTGESLHDIYRSRIFEPLGM